MPDNEKLDRIARITLQSIPAEDKVRLIMMVLIEESAELPLLGNRDNLAA